MLSLHVEYARYIIQDQELGLAHEHCGDNGRLDLPTGEPDAPSADHGSQPLWEGHHIGAESSSVQGACAGRGAEGVEANLLSPREGAERQGIPVAAERGIGGGGSYWKGMRRTSLDPTELRLWHSS
jgi:hypothetical protein